MGVCLSLMDHLHQNWTHFRASRAQELFTALSMVFHRTLSLSGKYPKEDNHPIAAKSYCKNFGFFLSSSGRYKTCIIGWGRIEQNMILLLPFFPHRYDNALTLFSQVNQPIFTKCLDSDHSASKLRYCIDSYLYNHEGSEMPLYLQADKLTCNIFTDAGRWPETTKSETKDSLLLYHSTTS